MFYATQTNLWKA